MCPFETTTALVREPRGPDAPTRKSARGVSTRSTTPRCPPSTGQAKPRLSPRKKARRWVDERVHSWTNRARRLLVRWEKKAENYLAFIHLQFAYTTLQAAGVLG